MAKSALQPFDAIKTVQQGHAGLAALSVADAVATLVQRAGVGALYSGLFVSLVWRHRKKGAGFAGSAPDCSLGCAQKKGLGHTPLSAPFFF